jgi:hypothetical protein
MRQNEQTLVLKLRDRMGRLGGNGERTELLVGTVLALTAAGWSKPTIRRVMFAITTHTFGDGVATTVTNAVCKQADLL